VRVLVTAASRHGSTAEIADRIGGALRDALSGGAQVDVRPADDVTTVDGYDAVVLGSAVYMGRWLDGARRLAETHASALSSRPVWLFSSGPIGDPPKPDEEPVDVAHVVTATGARAHEVFAGRLDRHRLGFAEKAVVLAFRVPDGDFRDWAAVDAWANGIAGELRGTG
jgi:menaquinone-dependent protoporphyrinogen oxidase